MAIYWVNLLLILIWVIYFNILRINRKKSKKILFVVIFIQMYLILALRSKYVGSDLNAYINFFNITKFQPFWDFDFYRYEIGYILLNKLLIFLKSDQIFIAVISFIPLFIIFKFIYKESKIPWISIFLFITLGFYTNSFNIIRQIFAMSIITISYKYLVKNDIKKFILTILLASCFHITSIVFALVYLFRRYKINIKNYLVYIFILLIIYLAGYKIIYFALSLFSTVSYEVTSNGGESMLILLIGILVFGLLNKKNVLFNNSDAIVLYNIHVFAILMQILALKFSLFARVGLYFLIFDIIYIPEVIKSIKTKNKYILSILVTLVLSSILYLISLQGNSSNIVPYVTFWNI